MFASSKRDELAKLAGWKFYPIFFLLPLDFLGMHVSSKLILFTGEKRKEETIENAI